MEGDRKGVRVEAPKGPFGQEHVQGWEGGRGGPGILEGHQGRVHGSDRAPEGGEGENGGRGGGQVWPTIECIISFIVVCIPFVFPLCFPLSYFFWEVGW